MSTIWDRPNGGALTGTERFAADKAGDGDPANSVYYTAAQLAALAAASGRTIRIEIDTDVTIVDTDANGIVAVVISDGTDRTVTYPSALAVGFGVTVARVIVGGGFGRLLFAGSGAGSHLFQPCAEIVANNASVDVVLMSDDSGVRSWLTNGDYAPQNGLRRTVTASGLLYPADNHGVIYCAVGSSTDIELSASDNLPPGFTTRIVRVESVLGSTGSVRLITSGPSTHVFVPTSELRTLGATMEASLVYGAGSDRVWSCLHGSIPAPLVQSAHTAATRTLTPNDQDTIIPANGASNAIAVTLPSTLFGAAGAGRAFVCVIKVTSVAGGALTFVGSGGIVVSYAGKKPSATPYAAGDWLTITVDSATTATVFCASVIP